jgi:hypothetical protein
MIVNIDLTLAIRYVIIFAIINLTIKLTQNKTAYEKAFTFNFISRGNHIFLL